MIRYRLNVTIAVYVNCQNYEKYLNFKSSKIVCFSTFTFGAVQKFILPAKLLSCNSKWIILTFDENKYFYDDIKVLKLFEK